MPMAGSGSAVETPLPLQLALTWLVVALYTTNGTRENQVHSATFVASILEIITSEILEVCDDRCSRLMQARRVSHHV